MIPSAGNRRALIERGDADISFDLPPKDVAELAKEDKLTVVGTPIENAIVYIGMNVKTRRSTTSRCARRSPMRSRTRRSWTR